MLYYFSLVAYNIFPMAQKPTIQGLIDRGTGCILPFIDPKRERHDATGNLVAIDECCILSLLSTDARDCQYPFSLILGSVSVENSQWKIDVKENIYLLISPSSSGKGGEIWDILKLRQLEEGQSPQPIPLSDDDQPILQIVFPVAWNLGLTIESDLMERTPVIALMQERRQNLIAAGYQPGQPLPTLDPF
jgi:hypothetical protein